MRTEEPSWSTKGELLWDVFVYAIFACYIIQHFVRSARKKVCEDSARPTTTKFRALGLQLDMVAACDSDRRIRLFQKFVKKLEILLC